MNRFFIVLALLASASAVIPEFFAIGFRHIVMDGWDHILFILGLFFLTRDFRVLLLQMTLFTMAHSLTLGLSLYGWVSSPSWLVEVAIALSIAFVAIENFFSDKLSPWRPWMVGVFGLIHGLGFAHSFAGKHVAPEAFLPALFSFNLGIEAGQIAIVGLASAIVACCWNRDWYRKAVSLPASAGLACIGIVWAIERAF
jgi:HupE / UreJ protein